MWRILAIVLLLVVPNFAHAANPVVPCYFVFGDSLSDVGNNNNLKTAAKANYAPYGVDFPGGAATGRFSNGRNFVDVLAGLLGFEGYIPPFSNAIGNISQGVNYASGAAGIRFDTSSHLGDRIWLDRQLQNHVTIISKLPSLVQGSVSDHLNKCLYTINIGSNDYINNYFMPQRHYTTKKIYNLEQYAGALVDQYSQQLKILHATGARKVAIFGLGLIGCTPAEIAMNNATMCVDEVNQAAQLFNQKLVSAVDDLNSQLLQAKFTFIDTFAMQAASPPGALITNSTCCKLRSDYQCEASGPPCSNRNQYAFMDGFHPTEAVNVLAAKNAYKSPDPKFVHPVDISNLASS